MTDEPIIIAKKKHGFASMSVERRTAISILGGKAVPGDKRAFSRNRLLAAAAGRKGGVNVPPAKRAYSQNRALAARSGAKGGAAVPYRSRSWCKEPAQAARAGAISARKRKALKGGAEPGIAPTPD